MIEHLLNESGTFTRRGAPVSDGQGGETYGATSTWVEPCRVSLTGDDERDEAERERGELTYNVFLRPSSDAQRGDELAVRGSLLEVVVVSVPSISDAYKRAQCRESQAGA
jgi:hypothetical protein